MVFLVTLTIFLIKLIGTVKQVNSIIEKNRTEIDVSLRKTQDTMENMSNITNKTDRLLEDIAPDIRKIATSTGNTMKNVEGLVDDVTDTVDFVSESVIDTADSIKTSVSSYSNYASYIIDIVNYIRSLFKK